MIATLIKRGFSWFFLQFLWYRFFWMKIWMKNSFFVLYFSASFFFSKRSNIIKMNSSLLLFVLVCKLAIQVNLIIFWFNLGSGLWINNFGADSGLRLNLTLHGLYWFNFWLGYSCYRNKNLHSFIEILTFYFVLNWSNQTQLMFS